MRYYPDITEPTLKDAALSEEGRISTYGPPVGWDARLPTHPLGSGYCSWMDATADSGIISETYSSSDEPQTFYIDTPEDDTQSPTFQALERLTETLASNNTPLLPLSDFSESSTTNYLGDHYASYQEILNHTDIHNHINQGGPRFHTILGPLHIDRNNVLSMPYGLMSYTDNTFGRFPIAAEDNKVPYSCSTGGTRGFTNGYPLSDVHKHSETQDRAHELCFKGTAVNSVTVDGNGVATIDLCSGAGGSDVYLCSVTSGGNSCSPVHTLSVEAGDNVTLGWCNTTAEHVELTICASGCNTDEEIGTVTDGTNTVSDVNCLCFAEADDLNLVVSSADGGDTAVVTLSVDFDDIPTDGTWIQNCSGTICHIGPSTCHACQEFVIDVERAETWCCDCFRIYYETLAWDCLGHVVGTFLARDQWAPHY